MKTPIQLRPQVTARHAAAIAVLVCCPFLIPWSGGCANASDNPPAEPNRQSEASAQVQPVILLTGFEPFGPGRPANPSWEGIKALDNAEWNGYRLVCRQMKVVWGAPLAQLDAWVSEYHPTAIFSFGQGGGGSFSLESVASNERGGHKDNDGKQPPGPTIVEDGPAQFEASVDCGGLATLLSQKGYPVRVSSNAGRYLCEETLYTLEYLRMKERVGSTVVFCHVPPLNSQLGTTTVNAEYVQRFVLAMLGTWNTLYQQVQAPVDPRHPDVEKLIKHYFATWSNQDIDAYGKCFMDEAVVQYIDSRGSVRTYELKPFLASQREAHQRSRGRLIEVPETIDIRFQARLAYVVVYWKLTDGLRKTDYGYDHFTLVKSKDAWKIVNLVYYGVDRVP